MAGLARWVLALMVVPQIAAANSLLIEVRPTADPRDMVACYVGLTGPEMRLLEVDGQGMPTVPAVRWFARDAEVAALTDALATLIAQDTGPIDPDTWRLPPPPTITINWIADLGSGKAAGLYDQRGLSRPPSLDLLAPLVLEGGPCAALFTS